jgi:phosphoribosylamine---glycine ligase
MKKRTILIVGSGGREHAIGWKLVQSKYIKKIYFAPGNGGTSTVGENIPIASDDVDKLLHFVKTRNVDCTIVGPEIPLSLGIVNRFTAEKQPIFGPTKEAARLETSKVWAEKFLKRNGLPHPRSQTFNDPASALAYCKKLNGNVVIKADGLCQGKGVFVCNNIDNTETAIRSLMVKKIFGSAGEKIIIQEKLIGKEISVMAFSDGLRVVPLIPASDYKRLKDGNRGPNTGSMGSMAPSCNATTVQLKQIHQILSKTVQCMNKEGNRYNGVLYAGVMIAQGKPYILEFNCRFGDPETEVQLPLLKSDLFRIIESCIAGSLSARLVTFKKQVCVCVVLASHGYPGHYLKGVLINGLRTDKQDRVIVFHSGTKKELSVIKTAGGRVLGITAYGQSIEKARQRVYAHIGKQILFIGMQYRKDIGL